MQALAAALPATPAYLPQFQNLRCIPNSGSPDLEIRRIAVACPAPVSSSQPLSPRSKDWCGTGWLVDFTGDQETLAYL